MPSTDAEQYELELINEARLNPVASVARYVTAFSPLVSPQADIQDALTYFGVSGPALQAVVTALVPVQPLAFNDSLASAARGHSAAMIAADTQSHQLPGEADFGARISAQGYAFSSAGENVYAYADDPLYAQAGFLIDWGVGPNGMQSPAGHRQNIMNATFREVGIGITAESNPATAVGPLVVTEDFGRRSGSGVFVLGVAYKDTDHDGFYSVGEGVAGLNVALGSAGAVSSASGGYALSTSAIGSQTITLTGAGLSGAVMVTTPLTAGENLKVDIVDGSTLQLSGSATVSGPVSTIVALGTIGLALRTDDRDHTIYGTNGNDTITAGAGSDRIHAGLGSDVIDGGGGDDTVFVSFASTIATLTTTGGVTMLLASGISDTLTGIEHVAFTDRAVDLGTANPTGGQSLFGTLTHSTASAGGQVYALYDGLLGRAPDALGLEYWTDQFADGVAPKTLAATFLASAEGQARSGAADNATFVTQLYDATLHRNPDAAGLAYWTDRLAHGTSRADVGVGFALSSEHLANIQPVLDGGLFVPDADAAAVARVYYTMLSRAPDAAGLKFWTDAIKSGTPLSAETQTFLNLPEAQAKVAGLSSAQYVDLVYTNALGRHAEADGLAFWTNAIDSHAASRVDVTTQIGQSTEAQIHLAPLIEQGWHLA